MRIDSTEELLQRQLGDALALEQSSHALLSWLHDAAGSDETRYALEDCSDRAARQIEDLEAARRLVGQDEPAQGSAIASSLISDAIELIDSTRDDVRDEVVLAAGLRLEHLEIAVYESLLVTAEEAGRLDVRALLERVHGRSRQASDELVTAMRPSALPPTL